MYNNELINLIFNNQNHDSDYYKELYKSRNLPSVLRFAPSPTGFLHTGSLYTALINYMLATQNNGLFYLRIEDTDTKRTVEGSFETLTEQLSYFGINYNNDPNYGPYFQSERFDIYNAMIIDLLKNDKAYPCFLTETEIEEIRKTQQANNERTGIYGKYAKYHNITSDEAIAKIKNGDKFVIRLKSTGDFNNTIVVNDVLRGKLSLRENDADIVILKADGLPTYHFAHAVDDHFMGTTCVIRGEEWLTSLPIHYELFHKLNFPMPSYLHLDSIMKLDNGNKRKLSKRKDPEASVSYLMEMGYPREAIINYLLTLANSNYEEYLLENKTNDYMNFKLDINKMSKTGALFDVDKLNFISKESISFMPIDYLCDLITKWAKANSQELLELINENPNKFKNIINIGRDDLNPRKEFAHFDEILDYIKPFYNQYFDEIDFTSSNDSELIKKALEEFVKISFEKEESEWLSDVKTLALSLGFAKNKKEQQSLNLPFVFGEFMKIIRNKIFKSDNSPSLYAVLNILGIEEVKRRLEIK